MLHGSAEVLEEHTQGCFTSFEKYMVRSRRGFHEIKPHQKVKISVFNLSKQYEHNFFSTFFFKMRILIIVMYFKVMLRGEQLTACLTTVPCDQCSLLFPVDTACTLGIHITCRQYIHPYTEFKNLKNKLIFKLGN